MGVWRKRAVPDSPWRSPMAAAMVVFWRHLALSRGVGNDRADAIAEQMLREVGSKEASAKSAEEIVRRIYELAEGA